MKHTIFHTGRWEVFGVALMLAAILAAFTPPDATAQNGDPNPTSVISGSVTAAGSSKALGDATVEILPPPGGSSFDWTPIVTHTNSAGEYILADVPIGSWPVMASHPDYGSDTQTANVVEGQITTLDFSLGQSSDDTGSVAGTVTHGLTGEPVAEAGVTVEGIMTLVLVQTDELGRYRFDGVPTGYRTVTVNKPGFDSATALAHVMADRVTTTNLTLFPSGGEFGSGHIEGIVLNAVTGLPVQSVTVHLISALDFGPVRQTYTDAEGHFAFENVEPGLYGLQTFIRGYRQGDAEVMVDPETTATVEIRIEPIGPLPSGFLSGRVVDARTSEPLSGAGIGFDNAPTHAWVLTDRDGEFFFGGVAAGEATVQAFKSDYQPATVNVLIEQDANQHMTIALEPIAPRALGSVTGVVTDAETGVALKAAAIHFDAGGVSVRVVTDSAGRYGFGGVPAGSNFIRANCPGYELVAVDVDIPPDGAIVVDIALQPGGSVGVGAVAGRVFDAETEAPLKARIYYTPNGGYWPDGSWWGGENWPTITDLPFVETNERGAYLIEGLSHGYYMLHAEADGYLGQRQFVMVNPGVVSLLDFALQVFNEPATGGLEGKVLDVETGSGIPGAWVEWRWEPNGQWTESGPGQYNPWPDALYAGAVQTDSEGGFSIGNLLPGIYNLHTRAENYEPHWSTTEITESTTTTVEIPLNPMVPPEPGGIIGWVGSAVDESPLAGARVTWTPASSGVLEIDWRTPGSPSYDGGLVPDETGQDDSTEPAPNIVLTDDDGRYEIPGLPQGVYLLLVETEGFASARRLVWVGAGQTVEADFLLQPGIAGFGGVTGIVIDGLTSQPLANAFVWAIPRGPITIMGVTPDVVYGSTETDASGRYLLENLPAGPLTVHAALAGYQTAGQRVDVPTSDTATANFSLRPISDTETGHISGQVIDELSNLPVAGAVVQLNPVDAVAFEILHRLDLDRRLITDDQGFFLFESVPVGAYVLEVYARGYLPGKAPVEVSADETTDIQIALEPQAVIQTGEITGSVVDAVTSDVLSSVTIHVQPLDATQSAIGNQLSTRTDASGVYRIPDAPAGACMVYALRRGYLAESREIIVPADGVVTCDFALTPITGGGAIEGVVRDAFTGDPIADALVVAPHLNLRYPINADNAAYDRTDEEGRYRIEPVPAGQQVVMAIAAAYYQDAQLATVEEGAAATVDFDLIPKQDAAMLWIRAWYGAGQAPLEGVKIELSQSEWIEPDSEWNPWRDVTDGAGQAGVPNVEPNGEMVRVHIEGYGFIDLPAPAAGSGHGLAAIPMNPRPHAGEKLALITLRLGWDAPQGETERLTYQWRKNGVIIPEATEPELDTEGFLSGDVLTCQVGLWIESQLVAVTESNAAMIAPPDGASVDSYWMLFE